jgi:2-phosphoglycolate phosphatase
MLLPPDMPGDPLRRVRAILFDLDGTLVDSAPDLTGALNDLRAARGLQPWPADELRGHCGSGARGMLGVGMQCPPDDPRYPSLREEFLNGYEQRMLRHTQVFNAVPPLLDRLQAAGLPWGIVTNKAMRFAQPMAMALGLWPLAAALVAGDSTPHTKPHPAPLLEAARGLGVAPEACVYVGDDPRDVAAGRAAGMATLVAAWGYIAGADRPPEHWGADDVLSHPQELLTWLDLA